MEKLLRSYFTFSYQLFGHPFTFRWEPGLRIYIACNKRSWHFKLWRLNYIFNFIYLIALVHLMTSQVEMYTSVEAVFHGLWIMAVVGIVLCQATFFFLGDDVIQFIKENIDLIKKLEKDHSTFGYEAFRESEKVRAWLFGGLVVYCLTLQIFVVTPILLMFQQGVWQLGSHVSRGILWIDPDNNMLALIIGLAVDHWHITHMQSPGMLVVHFNMSFMHTFKTSIHKILERQLKPATTSVQRSLRYLQEDMRTYSKLRILTTLYNSIYGDLYVFPFKMLMATCLVLMATITVTSARQGGHSFLLLFGALCNSLCTTFLIVFTTFMAMVNEYSVKLLKNLRTRRECQATCLGRRLIKSFKVEAVRSGNFYGIQRISCLTLLGLISNLIGSVLISL